KWQPDLHAGLMMSFVPTKKINAYIGGSARHIIRPADSFYGSNNLLGIRPIINAGAQIKAGTHLLIEPTVVFTIQKKAMETLFGTLLGYEFSQNNGVIYFGAHGRISDAVIFTTGYKIQNARLLLSYDVNVSSLQVASRSRGAVEISLVYVGKTNSAIGAKAMPCPRL